jgi:endoglucanase
MNQKQLLETLRAILSQPTAPFHEDAVRAEIFLQLAQLPHVTAEPDAFGNIVAVYRKGDRPARFALAAHMDHPGYVGGRFLGGVPEDYRSKNPPTRDYGAFAMWDLPPFEVHNGLIHSRACDDLIGCAAIIEAFRELETAGTEAEFYGLFTRAEEVGFVGAIQLARSNVLPRDVTIVSLETSSVRGGPAEMGGGVIIRVGDRTSIFDSTATAQLVSLAREREIRHQRLLMQGGTCEATAYQLYGYRTAGLCVALGNYHNCGPDTTIAAEFVSLTDVEALVQLCAALGGAAQLSDPHQTLRERLEREVESYREYFGLET